MALQTETYDLETEVQRLEDDISELEDILAEMSTDHESHGELVEVKKRLSVQLNGVRWAATEAADADYCPVWNEDVDEITLAGLTGGEVAKTNDGLAADAGMGAKRVNFVAAGTPHPSDEAVENRPAIDVPAPAPYVDASQSEEDRIAVVADLPDPYLQWAHARINELTTVGGNGRLNFDKLREEIEKTSPTASSSTT